MALVLSVPPVQEPVSLAEAKAHLRVDGSDEDVLIERLIATARDHLEKILQAALIAQTWTLWLDRWPNAGSLRFGLWPLASIEAIRVYDYDDISATIPTTDYLLDAASRPARLVARGGAAWPNPGRPLNGIEIVFAAGYGLSPSDVPASLRQSILLLVAHWYERREPVEVDMSAQEIPGLIPQLIAPFRMQRL